MEIKKEKSLKNFIQVVPETGISADYLNEFETLWSFSSFGMMGSHQNNWDEFWSSDKGNYYRTRNRELVSRYEKCYPPSEYDYGHISQDTKERIARLNEFADKASELFASGKFTRKEFTRIFVKASELVYGENDKRYIEEKEIYESEFGDMKY